MAKGVAGHIKLQIPVSKATPASPVGPTLGRHDINIVQFTKEFSARTAGQGGMIIPVVITVYADRSFNSVTRTPPAAVLIKKVCDIKSSSGVPNKTEVAVLKKTDLQKIIETKAPDLNTTNSEAAVNTIASAARSMGVTIKK